MLAYISPKTRSRSELVLFPCSLARSLARSKSETTTTTTSTTILWRTDAHVGGGTRLAAHLRGQDLDDHRGRHGRSCTCSTLLSSSTLFSLRSASDGCKHRRRCRLILLVLGQLQDPAPNGSGGGCKGASDATMIKEVTPAGRLISRRRVVI